jgi:hypothetical protein
MTFDVHAVVVCSASDFFKRGLKFALGKEAPERIIDLPEDDPEMIRRLITFLYLGDYDPTDTLADFTKFNNIKQHVSTTVAASTHHSRKGALGLSVTDSCACLSPNTKNIQQPIAKGKASNPPHDHALFPKPSYAIEITEPLTIHATMYALGDKYQVEGLSQLAKEKFESCIDHHAHSEDFISAVQIAYSSTPESNRGLRDAVLSAFRVQFRTDISQIPGAEAKLDSIDELSFLLIKSWPVKTGLAKPEELNFARSPFGGTSRPAAASGTLFGLPPSTNSLFTASNPTLRQ